MDKKIILLFMFIIFLVGAYDVVVDLECEPDKPGETYNKQCLLDYIPLVLSMITMAILLPWIQKKDEN